MNAGATITNPLAPSRLGRGLGLVLAYALLLGALLPGNPATRSMSAVALVIAGSLWYLRPRLELERLVPRRLGPILLVALLLRVAWILAAGVEQTSDFAHFDRMALDVLDGRYVLAPDKPTGPSLFFAGHYALVGHRPLVPQLSLALLSVAQIGMTAGLTSRALGSGLAGRAAAALLAIWPEHVVFPCLLGSDVLFATLALTAVWTLALPGRRPFARAALAGAALGLSHWMRPTAVLFLLPASIALLLGRRPAERLRSRCLAAGLAVAAFAACVAPIMGINQRLLGSPSPFPAQLGGHSLLFGSNLEHHGRWNEEDRAWLRAEVEARPDTGGRHPFLVADRVARELGLERLRSAPLAALWNAVTYKLRDLWARPAAISWAVLPSRAAPAYAPLYGLALLFHVTALALCAGSLFEGSLRLRDRLAGPWILVVACLITAAAHLLLETQPRYHHMFLPLFAAGAAAAATTRRGVPSQPEPATRRVT